jgi:hypothetical protein
MKYLVIDTTKELPIQMVVEDGRRFGTTQLLDWSELADYAMWVGVNGGRRMLDQFEVQLINDGMFYVWPVDEEGEPLHDECECQEVRHYDNGSRLTWIPKCRCETCLGQGHFVMDGSEVEEDDLCMYCDGQGWTWGAEFETDMQGDPLQNTEVDRASVSGRTQS